MKWPSYPNDHVRTYGTKKRALTWQHLTFCSFWTAHGILHSEDVTFLQIVRMQMQDREMPTRGQYRRLEWLATYAHRVYEMSLPDQPTHKPRRWSEERQIAAEMLHVPVFRG